MITNDIIEEYNHLKYIAKKTLHLITSHSSQLKDAQVLIKRLTGITISTRYGTIENIEFNNDYRLEITVYHKNRKGYVISNNIDNLYDLISKAINIAHHTSPDLYSGLSDKSLLCYHNLDLDLFHPIEYNITNIIKLVAQTETIAFKYDKRIIHTEGANFNNCTISTIIANTHGMLQGYNSTQYSLSCGTIGKNHDGSMEKNYAYTINRSFKKLHSPQQIGEECAKKTLKMLNSKKIVTTEAPVLFAAEIATSLFNHLIYAINGKNVYRKSTFLLHNLGKTIFPSWLCIKEQPHVLGEIASFPFDDEGIKSVDRIIVKDGILCTWLLDTYSARKLNTNSTGHANTIYNWYVNYHNVTFIKLIEKMHRGIIITDLMGQGVNIVTGDYSRGASGFWVENGEIQYPVSEVTISGNLKNMFLNIISIGNDTEKRSHIKCGSILISSIKIAGK